jgi:cytochrome c-type biogenesis protein CcmH/NrfG
MRLLLILCAVAIGQAQPSPAERLIEAGHWKRAHTLVETRLREAPTDALSNFLLSQIRGAFGDRSTPLALAEKAVSLDGRTAKYHRQLAEVLGVTAQHAGAFRQLLLARRFRGEIDAALSSDPRDLQALRDLLEFYLLAPGLIGGDPGRAVGIAARIGGIDAVEGLLGRARIAEFHKDAAAQEALLRQAAEAQSATYKAKIALAQFYLDPGHLSLLAAEAHASAAMKLDPSRVDAYAVLAVVYADRGEWNCLESILATGLQAVPDDPSPHYRAAERLADGRDPVRAERYLRLYLAQEPEGNQPSVSEARWKLGVALRARGRVAEALAEFRESVRLDPESRAALELKRVRNSLPAITPNSTGAM